MKKIISAIVISAFTFSVCAQKSNYHLLIGTYTDTAKSLGIYSYDVDLETGAFNQISVSTGISNPSYLAITSDKKFVYSVNESQYGGAANAFLFDKDKGKLTFLNSSLTQGGAPCYISVTKKHVFTANYVGGSISVFGRKADGSLTDALQIIQHVGKSVNAQRQNEPHVHQVILSPDQKYLVANDLGSDKITVYKYNPNSKSEILFPIDTLSSNAGSGPRHATFSKDGKKLYVLHEMSGAISVLKMKSGKLSLIQETSVVRNKNSSIWAADIHFSPDGKFLYATNRSPANDITCFSVAKDGKLTFLQQVPTGGDGPRNFAITPDGQYVFVAHQFTDNVVVLKRNIKTGELTDTGKKIEVGIPVCLQFY